MNTRIVLFVLGLSAAFISLAQNLYVPLLPRLQHDLHTSLFMVSATVSCYTIALAVMQIVFGPVIDKKGRRAVLLPSMLLFALASVGCAFSNSVSALLFFRVLQGIGAAAVPLVAATMIGDLFESEERVRKMATYQMILGLSPAFGPLLGGVIGDHAGYQGVFFFLSAVTLIMALVAVLAVPETKPAVTREQRLGIHTFAVIFKHQTGAASLLAGFALYYLFSSFTVFLPEILSRVYSLDAKQIGGIFLLLMTFSFLGSKISGRLQAKRGAKKSLVVHSSLVLGSLAFFLAVGLFSIVGLFLSLAALGFTVGLTMSVPPTLLAEAFAEERATAIGIYNFVRYAGMAAAPLLGSLFYETGGIWLLFGCTAVLMGWAILYAKKLWHTMPA